jgi:hypothetical protein
MQCSFAHAEKSTHIAIFEYGTPSTGARALYVYIPFWNTVYRVC